MKRTEQEQFEKIMRRLESGELIDQPCWSFIRDLNSYSRERLESVALRDGYRTYSYRQMFRHWERYAEAFSGMGINAVSGSRAALIGTPLPETIFAYYGLNMTGASVSIIYHFDLYDDKQIESMIEREKITDLVVSELFAYPQLMKRLLRMREPLGLRSIIVLSSPMGGDYAIPALELIRNINREQFREMPGGVLMEDLLQKYEGYPISYGKGSTVTILHTTGTVSGMHKPVPLTDKAMNAFVASAIKAKDTYEDFKNAPKHLVTYLTLNMSWVYAMVDMLHAPLGMGMEIVSLPCGATNPRYSEAIVEYGINVLFTSKSILDTWLKTMPDIDLSALKIVFMGGSYVSPEFKRQFNNYLRSCGSTARIINGYGLSELGGACLLCPTNRDDDAIGFLLPGFKAKILVEDENRYYDISDGPRTGVLLLSSPTMSTGRLGDEVFFELESIDGEDYFNTHDLVRVNKDGSLTCIGRSNQYFVNNAGVRFDAGLIENAVTSQPGIAACGLTPEFNKMLHDNVPVLYVEMSDKSAGSLTVLRKALIRVFIEDGMLSDTNMPSQCVIVESMPLNSGGKVDGKKLASGTVTGSRFSVKPVRMDGKVVDILLVPAPEGEDSSMGAGIPEELEGDIYNILSEVFACIPDLNEGRFTKLFKIPGLRELVIKLTDFDINNIPNSLFHMSPMLLNLAVKRYLTPLMKGVPKMSKNYYPNFFLSAYQGMMPQMSATPFMPPFMPPAAPFMPPMLPFPTVTKSDSVKTNFSGFNSSMAKYWKEMIESQQETMDWFREQWEQYFDYNMDMWDSFIAFLPDEMVFLPGAPSVSPKEMAKWAKKFMKMANEHLVEQAETGADFAIKGQKQVREMVSTAMDKVEKSIDEMEKQAKKKEVVEEVKAAEPVEEVKAEEPVEEVKAEAPVQKAKKKAKEPVQAEAAEVKKPRQTRQKKAPAKETKAEEPVQAEAAEANKE